MEDFIPHFPEDILPTIMKFIVRSSDPYRRALQFAKGSEDRRRAIIEALEYRVVFRERDRSIFRDLVRFFGHTIQHISLTEVVDDLFLDGIPDLEQLRSANITSTDKQLMFIKGKSNLTTLEIKVPHIRTMLWLPAVFGTLRSLKNLTLHLPEFDIAKPNLQKLLAKSCSSVTKLDLRGPYPYKYMDMVKELRSLRSISYSNSVRMFLNLGMFLDFEEVHLLRETVMRHAEFIGPPVKTLLLFRTQSATEILKLENCPNLRTLLVPVENGAERALLGNTQNLESLDLRWENPPGWFLDQGQIEDEGISYQPDGGTLLEIVRLSPKLRRLLLERALLPAPLLINLFQKIGDRLEQFGVHMTGQHESTTTRLKLVLTSLSLYCPNIKSLLLMGMEMEIRATRQEIRECEIALSRASRRCTELEISTIQCHIKAFVPT